MHNYKHSVTKKFMNFLKKKKKKKKKAEKEYYKRGFFTELKYRSQNILKLHVFFRKIREYLWIQISQLILFTYMWIYIWPTNIDQISFPKKKKKKKKKHTHTHTHYSFASYKSKMLNNYEIKYFSHHKQPPIKIIW